jgi:MATE family multidrug resistance protein
MNLSQYKKVVTISLPLVLSMGATTVMEFTDRVFLGNYDLNALAAATPAGITSFLFTAFFLGVAGYVNVFIAQYTGAKDPDGVGASLWQGIYFALGGTIFMAILSLFAVPLFSLIGHAPDIQPLEVIYFRILCLGTGASLLSATLSTFFTGRGLTRTVMVINMAGTLFNIPLDYALINGAWGFPEMGIQGAALATVAAWGLMATAFIVLVFTRDNNHRFHLWEKRQFIPSLFMRLMKFGIPGGVQFFLDILVFTFFILMVGRLGRDELAVTNMVMSINGLSYMPMFGFSMGVSTLVGQAMGAGKPKEAEAAARTTTHIALIYLAFLILLFLLLPEPLIRLFLPNGMNTAPLIDMGTVLLRFVALYLFFDSLVIIYTGVLKGAGDSQYVMWCMVVTGILFLFLPVWAGITFRHMGLYFIWSCITLYLVILFFLVMVRYRGGKWKAMSVIENPLPTAPAQASL